MQTSSLTRWRGDSDSDGCGCRNGTTASEVFRGLKPLRQQQRLKSASNSSFGAGISRPRKLVEAGMHNQEMSSSGGIPDAFAYIRYHR